MFEPCLINSFRLLIWNVCHSCYKTKTKMSLLPHEAAFKTFCIVNCLLLLPMHQPVAIITTGTWCLFDKFVIYQLNINFLFGSKLYGTEFCEYFFLKSATKHIQETPFKLKKKNHHRTVEFIWTLIFLCVRSTNLLPFLFKHCYNVNRFCLIVELL